MDDRETPIVVDLTQPDVIDVLTADHLEARELIADIAMAASDDSRREMADMLIAELVRHSVAEEMFVYPAMREDLPNGEASVEHDIAEHKELEKTMKRLEAADPGSAEFAQVMGELEATLLDHITDEEGEQFPLMREHMSREKLLRLADQVAAAKLIAPTRPHPLAPNSALFHVLVGPGVGLVDRLRDKLSGRVTS